MQSTEMILIILAAAVGALVLIQAIAMFAMFLMMRKGMRAASEYAEDMKSKVNPLLSESKEMLETTRRMITRLEPKLEAAASDLAEMTRTANDEMKKIQASADEITERVRRQAVRVDGLTTTALDGMDRASRLLNSAVTVPVRQVSGVMAAAKAIIDVLRGPGPARRRRTPDGHAREDQFV